MRLRSSAWSCLLGVALVGMAVSCGGGGGGSTPTPTPTPAAPSISSFTASPSMAIVSGGTASLTGVFSNGIGMITPGNLSASSGTAVTVSPASTTTYTLTVTNSAGTAVTQTATVTVDNAPPTISSFMPNPTTMVSGGTATLTGVFTNGAGVVNPGKMTMASGTPLTVTPTATTTYTLTVTDALGTVATSTATITVSAAPPAPTITSFSANPAAITSGGSSILTGIFANGTGVITPGNIPMTSGVGVSVSPTATTAYTLTVTNAAGMAVTETATVIVTVAPGAPSITSFTANPTTITSGGTASLTGFFTNGTAVITPGNIGVTSGNGVNVSPTATTTYTLMVTNSAGTSVTQAAAITVDPPPTTPTITAPSNVTAGQSYSASIAAQLGSTYSWTITGGTNQGSTTGTSIYFIAGASGTVQLGCVVTNSAGMASSQGTATATIVAAPLTPIITAPTNVTANTTGLIASVTNQPGSTYIWTIVDGTITSGSNTNQITFTAGSSSLISLSCIVTNAAGMASSPGWTAVTIVAAPTISTFAAASTSITQGTGTVLSFTFSGGTGIVTPGNTTVTSGGSLNISPTMTTTYTLTVTNSAGTAVTQTINVTVTPPIIAPSGLTYSTNPVVYQNEAAITANTPSSTGGAVISYSVSPALPTGLNLNTSTGVISGIPATVIATATYTVTATNSAGNATVGLSISVIPSVYAGGSGINSIGSTNTTYWLNGKVTVLANTFDAYSGPVNSLAVSGCNVYATSKQTMPPGSYYLNGTLINFNTNVFSLGAIDAYDSTIVISGSDVYLGGDLVNSSFETIPGYWLNESWVTLPSLLAGYYNQVRCIAVSGGNVYAAGLKYGTGLSSCTPGYWLNGIWVDLPVSSIYSTNEINALFVFGSNVYAFHFSQDPMVTSGFWLNGTWNTISTPVPSGAIAVPLCCTISNGNVYLAGAVNTSTGTTIPGYWVNGTWVSLPLPSGSTSGQVNCIVVYGSDVYVGGFCSNSSSVNIPGYWFDGTWIPLTVPSGCVGGTVNALVVQ